MKNKLLIIGGVAAGATAAARARRMRSDLEITLLERGPYISYANCGLPYYLSGDITERDELLLQTPEDFSRRYEVDVRVNTEALRIDRALKRVLIRDAQGRESWIPYDKLILAQGGNPIMPEIPGLTADKAFKLWTVPDMDRLHNVIAQGKAKSAAILGGGFIGVEMAEAFAKRGLATTVLELGPSLMSTLDSEFGNLVASELGRHQVKALTNASTSHYETETGEIVLKDGRRVPSDLVLFSVGVRPELHIAREAGLQLGESGGLLVNESLQTSDPDILAAGDMVEVIHRIHGRKVRIPLAGPANRQGRIAATVATGGKAQYAGALGTSILKVMDRTAASAGLTERAARQAGFDIGVAVVHKPHHASYYPGAKEMTLKLVYARRDGKLLGAQAFGEAGIESRINALAVSLYAGQTVHDLAQLDLVYAPPYSSANDPINLAAFVAENDLSGFSPLITAQALKNELSSSDQPLVLDVRELDEWRAGHLSGAELVPLDELRGRIDGIPKNRNLVVHCRVGYRGHLALRILKGAGFQNVRNLAGGWESLLQEGGFAFESA